LDAYRTLVWAIDLDDGTLINALGSGLSRNKSSVFNFTNRMADGPGFNDYGEWIEE